MIPRNVRFLINVPKSVWNMETIGLRQQALNISSIKQVSCFPVYHFMSYGKCHAAMRPQTSNCGLSFNLKAAESEDITAINQGIVLFVRPIKG